MKCNELDFYWVRYHNTITLPVGESSPGAVRQPRTPGGLWSRRAIVWVIMGP